MDKFNRDDNLLNGRGEDDIRWITANGSHIPIKEGETPKEAVKKHFNDNSKVQTKKFEEQLKQVLDGSFDKKSDNLLLRNETPQIFIDKAGLPNLPLVMSYETAYLSMNEQGNIKGNYHNLGIDVLKKLPQELENPLYIFKSQITNRVESVVDIKDKKGNNVFVSVEFDTSKQIKNKYRQVNIIITAFAPRESYINKRLSPENIIYKRKN